MFSLGFGSKAAKAATAAASNGGGARSRLYKKKRPRATGGGTALPFEGLCICLSGFPPEKKEEYSKMVLDLGGE